MTAARLARAGAALAVAGTLACVGGWLAGWRPGGPYGGYPPTHPVSLVPAAPASALANPVEWAWAGGLEPTAIRVTARVARATDRVRLWVGEEAGLRDARTSPEVAATDDRFRIASLEVGGLRPDTRYFWAIEVDGEVDREPSRLGSFRTPPEGPFSFTVAAGSCAATGSSGSVFDTLAGHQPLFLLHMGDLHYENVDEDRLDLFVRAFGWVLRAPAQARLYRRAPVEYVFDDHDFGGNNSDRTVAARPAAQRAFRLAVPHRPLPAGDAGPVYRAFTIGRVRFVVTDLRSERSPRKDPDGPGKTMLGAAQKAWLEAELLAAKAQALTVWVSPTPWIAEADGKSDHWGGYDHERRELAAFVEERGIDRLVMLSGDAHMLAIDDGRHNRYGPSGRPGFPVFQAAAFDRTGSRKGGPYSSGEFPGGGHFGLMTVEDDGGETVTVRWSGRDWQDRELVELERTFPLRAQ